MSNKGALIVKIRYIAKKYTHMSKLIYGLLFFLILASCSDNDEADQLANFSASNRLSTGDSARDFLSEDRYKELVIEVVYVEEFPPSDEALGSLVDFINQYCHKSAGIEIAKRAIASPALDYYTIAQVDSLEKELRGQYNSEGRMALFVFYLDGTYKGIETSKSSGFDVVLGVSYRNTSFVVFKRSINSLAPSKSSGLESIVLRHEFSHLLGLVDLGTPMQTNHIDPENGHHCIVEDCLMNYKIETGWEFSTSNTYQLLPQLDPYCEADLRANGGK